MKVATFDVEANGLLPEADTVWCAAVMDHDTKDIRSFTPDTIDDLCGHLDTFDVLIGHNCIGYDFPLLRKVFGWDYAGVKVDTLLMSRMQRPRRMSPKGSRSGPHSVESWGIRLNHAKVEHDDWDKYSEHMLERCVEDATIQHDIFYKLLAEGKGEGWQAAHRLNHKLHHYLQLQEEYGWHVDQDHLGFCLYMLQRWMDKIEAVVSPYMPMVREIKETRKEGEYGWVKKPFLKTGQPNKRVVDYLTIVDNHSVGSPSNSDAVAQVGGPFSRVNFRPVDLDKANEVKTYLLDQGWEPAEWNTNNSGERTSPKLSKDDPFDGVEGSVGKLIAKRTQCKQRLGVMEGWRETIRPDGRLPAGVAGIAATGRLRHSGIVNVPSPEKQSFFAVWMRRCFVATPGMVMVGVDSKGNQVRQLAARMQDEEFTDAVLHGDFHSVNMEKAGLPTRGHAKNFFYGFIFGAGDAKVGKLIGKGAPAGRAIKERYINSMPGLRRLVDRLTAEWQKTAQRYYDKDRGRWVYINGYITGIDGRPILVASEHTVLCYAVQSDEAIQMSAAYVMLHHWAEQKGWVAGRDWGMLIFMHDEFQMECKPELATELGELACKAIRWAGQHLKIQVPHDGDMKTGMNWADCH
jgi:hypothetical protein